MPVINADNREAWQQIANTVSVQHPGAGKKVRVNAGKHHGKEGIVQRHERDPFQRDAWRYGGEANLHMREMAGRYGFRIMVRTGAGETFFTKADNVTVLI